MDPADPSDRFGVNLQRTRQSMNLSQEELARRAGVHEKTISRYECGVRAIGLLTAIGLADALGVELKVLYEGIRWDPDEQRFECDPPGPPAEA